jgi:hypothetical protein
MALTTFQEIDAYVYNGSGVPVAATPRDTLLRQIRAACVSTAIDIITEADTTPNHANRISLAVSVVNNPVAGERFLMPILVVNSTALWAFVRQGSALADSDVKNNISATWNAVAGVSA